MPISPDVAKQKFEESSARLVRDLQATIDNDLVTYASSANFSINVTLKTHVRLTPALVELIIAPYRSIGWSVTVADQWSDQKEGTYFQTLSFTDSRLITSYQSQ